MESEKNIIKIGYDFATYLFEVCDWHKLCGDQMGRMLFQVSFDPK